MASGTEVATNYPSCAYEPPPGGQQWPQSQNDCPLCHRGPLQGASQAQDLFAIWVPGSARFPLLSLLLSPLLALRTTALHLNSGSSWRVVLHSDFKPQ